MASHRETVYKALIEWPGLAPLVEDRIYEASSIDKHYKRPLLAIRMHTGFPVQARLGRREYVAIWAHDDTGDYMQIDSIHEQVRLALESITPSEKFLEARWIETSVDLRDDFMESICRYQRFQLTSALLEHP